MEIKEENMEIKYNVKIQIETINIIENLIAFKFLKYRNDTLVNEYQGITTKEDFSAINEFGEFKTSKYAFWPLNLLKMHATAPHNSDFDTEFLNSIINNPYDIVKEGNWQEKYFLGNYNGSSEDFIDIYGVYQPKAVYMDYMSGIDESNYNLQGLLDAVKSMPNVVCLSEKVEIIPWYNQEEGRREHIRFIFIPTLEEYEKLYKLYSHTKAEKSIELLGLQEYKR